MNAKPPNQSFFGATVDNLSAAILSAQAKNDLPILTNLVFAKADLLARRRFCLVDCKFGADCKNLFDSRILSRQQRFARQAFVLKALGEFGLVALVAAGEEEEVLLGDGG
jgi:hypothetical protein